MTHGCDVLCLMIVVVVMTDGCDDCWMVIGD